MGLTLQGKNLIPVRRDRQIGSFISSISSFGGSGGGGSTSSEGGTFNHAILSNLAYADSGHTGFAPLASPTFTGIVTTANIHASLTSNFPTLGTGEGHLFLSPTDNLWGMYIGNNNSSGSGWIQQMRNDSAIAYSLVLQPVGGNVGIGITTPPLHKLEVGVVGTSVPSWASIVGNTGIGVANGNKLIYLYNDGTTLKLDAYDYGGAGTALSFSLAGNGGNVTVGGNLTVTGEVAAAGFKSDLVYGNTAFVSGFAGSGYQLDKVGSDYSLTVDNLTVRKMMKVYELQINKISAVNGGLIISCANGKSVALTGTTKIWFDTNGGKTPIQFIDNDWIRAQQWDNGVNYFFAQVTADIGADYIVVDNVTGTPWATMDLVQVGHPTNAARQSIIYITAADTNNPYIQMLSGVTDGNFTAARTRMLLGNLAPMASVGIVPATPGFGLYSDNVFLSGKIVASSGSIGGFTITANELYAGSGATRVEMQATGGFWAGATAIGDAPFSVTPAGTLKAIGVAEIGTNVVNDGILGTMNVAIKGYDIWENSLASDGGHIDINRIGYAGETSYLRNFYIYNGKGSKMVGFVGVQNQCVFYSPISLTNTIHADTCMDLSDGRSIDNTPGAFIPPRMTTTQRDAIATPIEGMMIWNTTSNRLNYYDGTGWAYVTYTGYGA